MPRVRNQIAHEHVEPVILSILRSKMVRSTADIQKLALIKLAPVGHDKSRVISRPNEQRVEQILSNTLRATSPLCNRGWIERVSEGHFRITELDIAKHDAESDELSIMTKQLDRLLGSD